MTADLQTLLDERAIHRLLIRYFDRIDALDPFGAAELFAEDATADLMTGKIYRGSDAIGRALARILLQYQHTSHHITNHLADVEGDRAVVHTYVYAFHRFPDERIWHLWARNEDVCERRRGEWVIVERVLVPIDADPTWELIDDSWFRPHPGRNQRAVVEDALAHRGEKP